MSGNIVRVEVTDSTNRLAKTLLPDAPHGTAVVALRQTAGRGRMGRTFFSPQGGIYLTLLLRPTAPLSQYLHLTPVLAVAACDAVQACTGIRPGCKWVNDLILDGKKLAGILTEITGGVFVVGIGLNCNTDPADLPPVATVISADRETLTAELIARMTQAFDTALTRREHWLTRYRKDCITLRQEVRAGEVSGIAVDVDEDGALLIRTEKELRRVQTGEVLSSAGTFLH